MLKVLKYHLNTHGQTVINLPLHCKILSVQVQHNNPVLYVLSDDYYRLQEHVIHSVVTGGIPPDSFNTYLGTAVLDKDTFILHYFTQ